MDRDARLGVLASAILDGTPVDWPAADSNADASDRAVVRHLQVVAEIAALHRRFDVGVSRAATVHGVADETRPATWWGHLRLLEPVGSGTFGHVYRAWDPHLDREVALKLLRSADASSDPVASLSDPVRVVNEGQLLARVRHAHVITVYGAERRDGVVGIWMEFIRGCTLQQIVEQQGPLSAREAVAVGADLCSALAAVHSAGLLHRDVTARNVMREEGGRIVLMDFGAGHESDSIPSGCGLDITGTPLYMAPELFDGGGADRRTDIYALGTLLYYLVTARFPVTGRSLIEIREAHTRSVRTRLRDVRADLPAAFVQAVEKAIAPDRDRRHQTAGEFEAALESAVTGIRHGRSRLQSRPIRAALLVTAVGLIGAAVAIVFRPVVWPFAQPVPSVVNNFQPRGWMLITNFENGTGDRELDGVVTYSLERELESSSYVNVVSRARVEDALVLMDKPTDSVIDRALGQEVSLRDGGIRVLMAGRLDKLGSNYIITAQIIEPRDGRVVAAFTEEAQRLEELTAALRRLATRTREMLGEQPNTIESGSPALERVTTPSLRALRLYSESYQMGQRGQWPGALELARQAVAEDPQFATAQIWVAWTMRRTGSVPEAYQPIAELALRRSERSTDWERFWIAGSYYTMMGDDARAEGAYQALLQLQPDHYWGINNLMALYQQQGRARDALPYVARAADIRPHDGFANYRAAHRLALVAGDFNRARPYMERARNSKWVSELQGPFAWCTFFDAAERLSRRDTGGVAAEVRRVLAGLSQQPEWARDDIASKAVRYSLQLGQSRQALAAAEHFHDRTFEHSFHNAQIAFALDDYDSARQYIRTVPFNAYMNPAVWLMARLGLAAEAEAFLDRPPAPDLNVSKLSLDQTRGSSVALAKGDLDAAIPVLEAMISRRIPGNHARSSRDLASVWLRKGNSKLAMDALRESWEWDRMNDVEQDGPYGHDWMPNALLLAELYRRAGRGAEAQPIEADLVRLLSMADEDFPLLVKLRNLQTLGSAKGRQPE